MKYDYNLVLTIFNNNRDKNMQWFHENYATMIQWCRNNGGIRKWKKIVGRSSRRLFNEIEITKILEENKDKNPTWFLYNEPSVVQWCKRHGGWDYWYNKLGIKNNDFNAIIIMRLLEENKDKSNSWFRKEGIIKWCEDHGSWEKWAKEAGIKHYIKWNGEKVLLKFKENSDKKLMWFITNEQPMVRWCYRNGGLKYWAELAGI